MRGAARTRPSRPPARAWRAAAWPLLVVAGSALQAPLPAHADPTPPATIARTTRISYLAGGTVYLEAGRLDGLAVDDTVTVLHDTRGVATLRVTVLSGHHAACDTLATRDSLRVGDPVRYRARAIVAAEPSRAAADSAAAAIPGASADTLVTVPPSPPGAATATRVVSRPRPRISGRVGASGLVVHQDLGGGFRRPALDLRFDGRHLDGGFDLSLDVRSDRVMGIGPTPSEQGVSRVYRGSLTWRDAGGMWQVSAGRQSSAPLASVSLFDGALAEVDGRRFGAGVFGGSQPDPVTLGFSSAIVEEGVYGAVRSLAGSPRRWSLTSGAVTSTEAGQPNRDFLFAQASYQDPRLLVSASQEVDVMRGWRADSSSSRFSPTSSFVVATLRLASVASIDAGYDGRRNVLLYRDRITPETQFDDAFREGAWTGLTLDPRRGVRLKGDVRQRFGGPDERATTWTGSAELYGITRWHARLSARGSDYTSTPTRSQLWSFGFGADPFPGLHGQLSGGTRSTRDLTFGVDDRSRWVSLDGDLALALRWYLVGTLEHERGDGGDLTQTYLGLSWRF